MPRKQNTTPEAEVEVEATETITAKAVAEELGLDPKAFRRWLRRHTENRAGKGGRWNFTTAQVEELKAAYAKNPEVEAPAEA